MHAELHGKVVFWIVGSVYWTWFPLRFQSSGGMCTYTPDFSVYYRQCGKLDSKITTFNRKSTVFNTCKIMGLRVKYKGTDVSY